MYAKYFTLVLFMLAWQYKENYTMKKYELLAIFKPSLDSEELDKAVDKISSDIKSAKGEVSSVDKVGRKKLAYDLSRL